MLPILTQVFVVSGAITKMVRQNMVRGAAVGLHPLRPLLRPLQAGGRALRAPRRADPGGHAGRHPSTGAVSAAVTVELVFSLGGIGEYAIRSILSFDYPAIQGVVLIVALVSLLIYLLLDIIHAYLDPRVKY